LVTNTAFTDLVDDYFKLVFRYFIVILRLVHYLRCRCDVIVFNFVLFVYFVSFLSQLLACKYNQKSHDTIRYDRRV